MELCSVHWDSPLRLGTHREDFRPVDSVVMVPDATASCGAWRNETQLPLLPTLSPLSLCSLVLTRYFIPLQHGRSNISAFADSRARARSEKLSSQHAALSLFKRVLYQPPPSTIQFLGGNMRHSQRRRFQNHQPSARAILHCLRTSGLIHQTCLGQLRPPSHVLDQGRNVIFISCIPG